MKKLTIAFTAILILATLTGCAGNLRQTYARSRIIYNATLEAACDGYDAGLITDKAVITAEPFQRATKAALDRVDTAIQEDDTDSGWFHLDVAQAGLAELREALPLRTRRPLPAN